MSENYGVSLLLLVRQCIPGGFRVWVSHDNQVSLSRGDETVGSIRYDPKPKGTFTVYSHLDDPFVTKDIVSAVKALWCSLLFLDLREGRDLFKRKRPRRLKEESVLLCLTERERQLSKICWADSHDRLFILENDELRLGENGKQRVRVRAEEAAVPYGVYGILGDDKPVAFTFSFQRRDEVDVHTSVTTLSLAVGDWRAAYRAMRYGGNTVAFNAEPFNVRFSSGGVTVTHQEDIGDVRTLRLSLLDFLEDQGRVVIRPTHQWWRAALQVICTDPGAPGAPSLLPSRST